MKLRNRQKTEAERDIVLDLSRQFAKSKSQGLAAGCGEGSQYNLTTEEVKAEELREQIFGERWSPEKIAKRRKDRETYLNRK